MLAWSMERMDWESEVIKNITKKLGICSDVKIGKELQQTQKYMRYLKSHSGYKPTSDRRNLY